jgi:hypothetical protein
MRQNAPYFSILLCLTPVEFACQWGEFCIQFNNVTGVPMLLERFTFHYFSLRRDFFYLLVYGFDFKNKRSVGRKKIFKKNELSINENRN